MTIAVHIANRAGFAEACLTATARNAGEADRVFAGLAQALAAERIEPLRERVYGALAAREALLDARHRQYAACGLDAETPCGFVDGAPPGGGDFAGVQILGVRPGPGHALRTCNGSALRTGNGARLWQGPGFRILHLTGVTGTPGERTAAQATQMFTAAAAAAREQAFAYRQTVRTWIYLARLLDWYGEFNRVRSAAYREHRFDFPASTGIQGRTGPGECAMDALLVEGVDCRLIERTARQGPARAYGSAFARGVAIAHGGGATVHVSGTASIDAQGRSRHAGDPEAQSVEMLLDVGAVLAEAGMALADIRQATLFCKHEAAAAGYRRVHTLLSLPDFPTVVVGADVCRPELLVEMEAVACR
jgi:enamine deaminase RidA (YjgF/YER057c/UK114 family)